LGDQSHVGPTQQNPLIINQTTEHPVLQFLLARAKEPSSYAGLATLLTAAGIHYSTDLFNAAVAVAVAVAGLVAILLPEKKGN